MFMWMSLVLNTDIKKGVNCFVYVFLIPIGGAGITFGSNKVRNNPRQCVNPPHPIPDP